MPAPHIHEPWKMSKEQQNEFGCIIGQNYPEPIRQPRPGVCGLTNHDPSLDPSCSHCVHRVGRTGRPACYKCVKVQCLDCRPCTGLLQCVHEGTILVHEDFDQSSRPYWQHQLTVVEGQS